MAAAMCRPAKTPTGPIKTPLVVVGSGTAAVLADTPVAGTELGELAAIQAMVAVTPLTARAVVAVVARTIRRPMAQDRAVVPESMALEAAV
jgi:hypothetical protein